MGWLVKEKCNRQGWNSQEKGSQKNQNKKARENTRAAWYFAGHAIFILGYFNMQLWVKWLNICKY